MTHRTHNGQNEKAEFKRTQYEHFMCDEDDCLDALIAAAVEKKEHEAPVYQIEEKRE